MLWDLSSSIVYVAYLDLAIFIVRDDGFDDSYPSYSDYDKKKKIIKIRIIILN